MSRVTILAAFCAATVTGCSGRVSHKQAEPFGSSMTTVEIAPLDSPPPVPAEGCRDPRPQLFDQGGTGNVIVFGDLEQHLHVHEAPMPPSVLVNVRVEVNVVGDRDRRRRMVEQRITELLDRR